MDGKAGQVAVSRRITAAASDIFQVLIDPKSHLAMDGSGMVRGSLSDTSVSAVGDVFVIKMYYVEHGVCTEVAHFAFDVSRRRPPNSR